MQRAKKSLNLDKIHDRILEAINKLNVKGKVEIDQEAYPDFMLPMHVLTFLRGCWTRFSERGHDRIEKHGVIKMIISE